MTLNKVLNKEGEKTTISLYLNKSDKELIKEISNLLGIGISSFIRSAMIEKAIETKNKLQPSEVQNE